MVGRQIVTLLKRHRPMQAMQLRLCLLCAALVASMAMPTTDDVGTIVPEVTQLEEDPTQCFFLRSKEQVQPCWLALE